ncbi:MAG TPA: hypothetical protein DDZ88_24450 [Verrucomicrobiales bacterium]|nr:hypothetical protein [Verrucomicrobiales bacterium]
MSNSTKPILDSGMNLLATLQKQMLVVKEQYPDWYAEYEDRDPMTAARADLDFLLESAPTEFVAGLVVGVMLFRQQMAILTGRHF